ncbi:MAG: hypothetical protein PQJ61_07165 [Spirochaetales bacterium]|uniref:Uncharacterized protein n=1 Tax=Candidatus Thalassospirochaeta sargassi TaxID=3119039 RepID=A0AAJ1IC38_9SPIO|nr:hypothetical protein [Spirochaetales bacterium]
MGNSGFDYIKNMHMYLQPHTPFAAYKAAREGLLPPEAFIYRASSVNPLVDNPDNLEEIERILGQKERDLEINLLLIDILSRLIKDPDKEKALFAAESINAIENDYNTAIENLARDDHSRRAVLYTELAELNRQVPDLRTFYLREAFSAYRSMEKDGSIEDEDRLNMSRILIELGLSSQAKSTIINSGIDGADAKLILAEIAFRQRNYAELYEIMEELNKHRSTLDINQTQLIDYWMESR